MGKPHAPASTRRVFFCIVPTPQTHAGRAHAWQEGSTNDSVKRAKLKFHTAECSDDLTSMAKLILARSNHSCEQSG